jgi:hypothetical protein
LEQPADLRLADRLGDHRMEESKPPDLFHLVGHLLENGGR